MKHNLRNLTINEISKLEGFTEEFKVDEDVPLSVWYNNIQRLSDLSDGDIAKLIRQTMHLRYTIPEAMSRLRENPLAGYLGDGEILEAIAQLDEKEWDDNPPVASILGSFIEDFLTLFSNNKLAFPEDRERFSTQDREE
ncbi:contact-dependent growth inhibition system immunity protein [Paenibacillus sp. NPDC057934]|uniref:contact-dependent growth inhibition system immunity protein n=1 Tax=Paenibacillus sp. NPDC057934 TaxID=3346282 RepID=UPI0036DB6687